MAAGDSGRAEKVGYAAGAALVVGSFLPWITITAPFIGTVSKNGIDGDGIFTLIAGAIIAGVAFSWREGGPKPWPSAAMGIAGVAIGVLIAWKYADFLNAFGDADAAFVSPSIGIGLHVCAAGAAASLFAANLRSTTDDSNDRFVVLGRRLKRTQKVCLRGHVNTPRALRCRECATYRFMK